MKDVFKHFTVKDVEYPFAFNINVAEELDTEYKTEKDGMKIDGITAWSELVEPKEGIPSITALKFLFWLAINEGIDMENEERKESREPLTLKQIGRVITGLGENALSFTKESIQDSNSDGTEKNA